MTVADVRGRLPEPSKRNVALAAIVLVPFLVLAIAHWPVEPRAESGDWAQYLLHARAIARLRPYGDIGYIFTPNAFFVGPPMQPPGLPLTFAPFLALGVHGLTIFKLIVAMSGIAFLLLARAVLARDVASDPWLATAALLLVGASLESVWATNAPGTDLGFGAFIWGSILIADDPRPWGWRRAAAITVLGLAAMSYRFVGVAIVPAALLFAVLRFRKFGRIVFVPPAIWITGGLAVVATLRWRVPFLEARVTSLTELLWQLQDGVKRFGDALLELTLYPLPTKVANQGYHLLATALLVLGLILVVRRMRISFLTCFAFAYTGLLMAAPVATPRYWWPLYPLLALAIAEAVAWLASLVRPRSDARRASAALVSFALMAVVVAASSARTLAAPRPPTLLGNADALALFDTLRADAAREPVRAYFMNPRVLTWLTDIPAMPLVQTPREELLAELRANGITHVVEGSMGIVPGADDSLRVTIAQHRDLFEPRYHNGAFAVYRLRADSSAHP